MENKQLFCYVLGIICAAIIICCIVFIGTQLFFISKNTSQIELETSQTLSDVKFIKDYCLEETE